MLSQLFQAEQQGRMGKESLKSLAADKKLTLKTQFTFLKREISCFDHCFSSRGLRVTVNGFGTSFCVAPLLESRIPPTIPPAKKYPTMAIPPSSERLFVMLYVADLYPFFSIVTVKLAFRFIFGITQGVGSHINPRLVLAVAPLGSVSIRKASVFPRIIVAQAEIKSTTEINIASLKFLMTLNPKIG